MIINDSNELIYLDTPFGGKSEKKIVKIKLDENYIDFISKFNPRKTS
jgi:hypothetical protein